jgi:hypothetical protein
VLAEKHHLDLHLTVACAAKILWDVFRSRSTTAGTTLGVAWGWTVAAAAAWLLASTLTVLKPGSVAVEHAWYFAAAMSLCPGIAVLGSRRPTVRVWSVFVVLPLAAVLMWPVAVCWMPRGPQRPAMDAPAMLGFVLAGLMGFGNFMATRRMIPAILMALAVCTLLWAAGEPIGSATATQRRFLAVVFAMGASQISRHHLPVAIAEGTGWNKAWQDFRDLFGIVWSSRLAERINSQAARENWPVRLMRSGFVDASTGEAVDVLNAEPRADQAMRWLLRRFVDEEWIDERVVAEPVAVRVGNPDQKAV